MKNDQELHCPNPDCRGTVPPAVERVMGEAYRVRCPGCGLTGPTVGGKGRAMVAWRRIGFGQAVA